MKAKSRNRKSYKWRKRCDSSAVAKCRRPKIHGKRNPRKRQTLRRPWALRQSFPGLSHIPPKNRARPTREIAFMNAAVRSVVPLRRESS